MGWRVGAGKKSNGGWEPKAGSDCAVFCLGKDNIKNKLIFNSESVYKILKEFTQSSFYLFIYLFIDLPNT